MKMRLKMKSNHKDATHVAQGLDKGKYTKYKMLQYNDGYDH